MWITNECVYFTIIVNDKKVWDFYWLKLITICHDSLLLFNFGSLTQLGVFISNFVRLTDNKKT